MDCLSSVEIFENDLMILSAIPFIGTIPATCRLLLGLIQLISAVALLLFSSMDAVDDAFPDLGMYSIEHIGHGASNLFWGAAMAIPFLGMAIFILRKKRAVKNQDKEATPYIQLKYGAISPSPSKRKKPASEQSYLTRISFSLFEKDQIPNPFL